MLVTTVYVVLLSILTNHRSLRHVAGQLVPEDTLLRPSTGMERLICVRGSCSQRCGSSETNLTSCGCASECLIFGDCCLDFFTLCLHKDLQTLVSDIKSLSDIDDVLESVVPHYVPGVLAMFLYKSCEEVNNGIDFKYLWMISTCPIADHKSDALKCSGKTWDPVGRVPVSLTSIPSLVFKNIYCASCHGFDKKDIRIWQSTAVCNTSENVNDLQHEELLQLLRSGHCAISSKTPKTAKPRFCKKYNGQLCPLHSEDGALRDNSILCRSYIHHLVTSDNVVVRNQDCAACSSNSSVKNSQLMCEKKLRPFYFNGRLIPECENLSCEGRCTSSHGDGKCACDTLCLLFGDCCFDYVAECQLTNLTLLDMQNETMLLEILEESDTPLQPVTPQTFELNKTEKDLTRETRDEPEIGGVTHLLMLYLRFRQCVAIPPNNSKMIWMIARCPAGNATSQCEDLQSQNNQSLIPPASHVDNNALVFKNIFCGLCHGISKEKLQMWDCQERVHDSRNEMKRMSSTRCRLKMRGSEGGGRRCNPDDAFSEERNSSSWQPNWCHLYRYPVVQGFVQYRNPHCTASKVSCVSKSDHKYSDTEPTESKPGGLSILFNFKGNNLEFIIGSDTDRKTVCKSDEVFDSLSNKCLSLTCGRGKVARNGLCGKSGTLSADADAYLFPNGSREYVLKVDLLSELAFKDETIANGLLDTNKLFAKTTIVRETNVFSHLSIHSNLDQMQNIQHVISVEITFEIATSLYRCLRKLLRIQKSVLNVDGVTFRNATIQNFDHVQNLSCKKGTVIELPNAYLQEKLRQIFATESDALYPLDKLAFILKLNDSFQIADGIWVCGIPLNCDAVSYNLSDFVFSGSSLINKFSDQVLENNSYFIDGDTVLACHNFSQSNSNGSETFFRFDHVQNILTYVTSGISILSLVITLVVYCILPQLRNLPGRLTMSLSASLLVAQVLLLLIHVPKGVLCKVHAVALHFFWLCSFMWMGMMSVNLAKTFRSTSSQQFISSPASYHAKYACLAIGIPLVIVTVSALLDFLQVEGILIGYGIFGACWIANPRASLLLFGVPIALVLIINFVAFGLTLFSIERSLKLSKDLESTKKDKGKAFIYGKLFIIMGLSWISSFIAAFTDINFLWYIFIILNGLQGFCIFTSFICTDRVRRLLLKKWGRNEASSVYMTSTGTSRTSGIKSGL